MLIKIRYPNRRHGYDYYNLMNYSWLLEIYNHDKKERAKFSKPSELFNWNFTGIVVATSSQSSNSLFILLKL